MEELLLLLLWRIFILLSPDSVRRKLLNELPIHALFNAMTTPYMEESVPA